MIHRSIRRAPKDVGACAGNDEDSRASAKSAVEGDLLVSGKQEIAADDVSDFALSPFPDGIDRQAGEADAGLSNVAEADASRERDLRQHGSQPG